MVDFDLTGEISPQQSMPAREAAPLCHRDKKPCVGADCVMFQFDMDENGTQSTEGGCLEVSNAMAAEDAADRLSQMLDTIGSMMSNPDMLASVFGSRLPSFDPKPVEPQPKSE